MFDEGGIKFLGLDFPSPKYLYSSIWVVKYRLLYVSTLLRKVLSERKWEKFSLDLSRLIN